MLSIQVTQTKGDRKEVDLSCRHELSIADDTRPKIIHDSSFVASHEEGEEEDDISCHGAPSLSGCRSMI